MLQFFQIFAWSILHLSLGLNQEGVCQDFVQDQCDQMNHIFESLETRDVFECQYYCQLIFNDDCGSFQYDTTTKICNILNATVVDVTCAIKAGPKTPWINNCPDSKDPCTVSKF